MKTKWSEIKWSDFPFQPIKKTKHTPEILNYLNELEAKFSKKSKRKPTSKTGSKEVA